MKLELFVINCIRLSPRAASVVSDCLGTSRESLIKKLQDPQQLPQLALNLRCKSPGTQVEREEFFEFLAQAIFEDFHGIVTPQLTRKHIERLIDNADIQRLFSEVLDCVPDEVLQTLFSVDDLQATLDFLTDGRYPTQRQTGQVRRYLTEILQPNRASRLQRSKNTNEYDWEPIIDEEYWLRTEVIETLLSSDKVRNAKTGSQALAELIDRALEDEEDERFVDLRQSNIIRALGLLAVRRHLDRIISDLREGAEKDMPDAFRGMPSSLRFLQAALHYYELGNINLGLTAYFNYPQLLESLIPEDKRQGTEVDETKIINSHTLHWEEIARFVARGQDVGTYEVKCALQSEEGVRLQTILELREVPLWLATELERDVPRIAPQDVILWKLLPGGEHLYQRLLFQRFPLLDPESDRLVSALTSLGNSFIQAVALSCNNPIPTASHLWDEEPLADRLHYSDLPISNENDILYPNSTEEIINRLQKYYATPVEVIQGIGDLGVSHDDENPEHQE